MKDTIFDKPLDCCIKDGWRDAGREGKCYGFTEIRQAIVLWDGEDELSLFRAGALLARTNEWTDLMTKMGEEKY